MSLELVELLRSLVVESLPERRSQSPFSGESASPFIVERDGLQVREKERKCIHVLPSLIAHAIVYEMVASAHNTVYA